ncbi:MAG: quinone oxidoreductase family protein [Actinomycetota bacterium]
MRAVVVSRPGGSAVLEVREQADPEPGAAQLLVAVAAAGVNFIDVYQREGRYPVATPFVLGLEGAGTVRAVGPGVTEFAPGDRVAWKAAQGSYAELAVVPVAEAVPVPEGVSDELAAAAMLQGLTAQYLTTATYPVQEGDLAVVHAAAGGVGLLLTQAVRLRGGRVLATVSTEEKAQLARDAGAEEVVVGYDGFAEAARRLTGGRGAAVVYDGVGRSTFDAGLDALRLRGTMALYGAASGPVPPVDPQVLNTKGSLFLTRPTLWHYTATREELLARAGELFGWIRAGRLDVRIGGRYPLAEARRAHDDLEGRRTTGKVLLLP